MDERERLIAGALDAVGEMGYAGVSLDAVAARAGLTEEAAAALFEDEQALFVAACEAAIAAAEARMRAAAEGAGGWRDRLRAGLRTLLELLDARPLAARAVLVEVDSAGPPAQALRAKAMRRAVDFIDSGREDELAVFSPAAVVPEAIAASIYSALHRRLVYPAAEDGAGRPLRSLLPDLMHLATLPFYGPAAATEELLRSR